MFNISWSERKLKETFDYRSVRPSAQQRRTKSPTILYRKSLQKLGDTKKSKIGDSPQFYILNTFKTKIGTTKQLTKKEIVFKFT